MLQTIIIYLIRKRLDVKAYERFQFENQKSNSDVYYFGKCRLWKETIIGEGINYTQSSNVSLNWLLDDRCKIIKKEG